MPLFHVRTLVSLSELAQQLRIQTIDMNIKQPRHSAVSILNFDFENVPVYTYGEVTFSAREIECGRAYTAIPFVPLHVPKRSGSHAQHVSTLCIP